MDEELERMLVSSSEYKHYYGKTSGKSLMNTIVTLKKEGKGKLVAWKYIPNGEFQTHTL